MLAERQALLVGATRRREEGIAAGWLAAVVLSSNSLAVRGRAVLREQAGMAQFSLPLKQAGFGKTSRRDLWWVQPLAVFLGLSAFVLYSM